MGDPAREVETQALNDMMRRELVVRLDAFSRYSAETFGEIGAMEAVGVFLGCAALLLMLLWGLG